MRIKLSAILLSLPLALAACARSSGPSSTSTIPPAPEFAAQSETRAESEMAASDGSKPIPPEDQIFFQNDSDALNSDGRTLLSEVASWVMAEPGRHIVIEGHADKRGAKDYNLDLSNRRALAAATYLRSIKVPDDRIIITAVGESESSLAPGGVNRRIVIFATEAPAAASLQPMQFLP